jgi:hypothetical protein
MKHLLDAIFDTGSYRYLIHERMGYGPEHVASCWKRRNAYNNAFMEPEELRGRLKLIAQCGIGLSRRDRTGIDQCVQALD